MYIICPIRETWVPDSPAPLSGFGHLTELPRVFCPYVTCIIVLLTQRLAVKHTKIIQSLSDRYQNLVLYRYTQVVCSLTHRSTTSEYIFNSHTGPKGLICLPTPPTYFNKTE